MKKKTVSRPRTRAIGMLAVALPCGPAEAHLNVTGMGPIYDGLMHFLTSPEDLVPALALALLAGLRGTRYGRRAMFVLPAAWLLGSLFGLSAATASAGMLGTSFWFLALGGLVVVDAKLSLRSMTALTALLGLLHGYLNGAGMGVSAQAVVAAIGLGIRGIRSGRARCRARRSFADALGANRRADRRKLDRRERTAHAWLDRSRGILTNEDGAPSLHRTRYLDQGPVGSASRA